MFELAEPWWQFVVRGTVVYLFLFALFRFGGKRQAGQLTPFDLTLLLIISNALQNAMVGSDTSLLGGVIVVLTLVIWTRSLGFFSARNKRVERILEGRPELLIHNGRVFEDVLRRNDLSHADLNTALRHNDCFDLNQVDMAILETNGSISVRRRQP
ncbi:MAG: YetF domain-containing protein [Dokdonella sp.]